MTLAEMRRTSRIWIAWETQRRTITLSTRVGATLHILDFESHGILRYPLSLLHTARLLFRHRGGIVFVQNPSMVLATFAALCKGLLRFTLVVDRHSNFLAGNTRTPKLTAYLLDWMSTYSIERADLTIVTNPEIEEQYIRGTGRGFILPDPYPDVPRVCEPGAAPVDELRVFFVSSWETDEPIAEVMEVCRLLGQRVKVFISGRMKERYASLVAQKPDNFILTGFLPDATYFELMASVDCVIAISTRPGTLCCGAYEGVAMGKPLILNDLPITKNYFGEGAAYTDSTVRSLEAALQFVSAHRRQLTADIVRFRRTSSDAWRTRLTLLEQEIQRLHDRR